MPGNSLPLLSRVGAIGLGGGAGIGTSVISDYDGTGANNVLIFTADATNGSFVQRIRLKAKGTNAVSVARVFVNNGSTPGTAGNNSFIEEQSLPATTSSTTTATPTVDIPLNIALPPGYRLYLGISAAANLSTGWTPTVIAGHY